MGSSNYLEAFTRQAMRVCILLLAVLALALLADAVPIKPYKGRRESAESEMGHTSMIIPQLEEDQQTYLGWLLVKKLWGKITIMARMKDAATFNIAKGCHQCSSSTSVGHTCDVYTARATNKMHGHRINKWNDCCPHTPDGGNSIEYFPLPCKSI